MAAPVNKPVLRGYVLETNFSNLSGGAQWTYARKDGKAWFIKRFVDPVWPKDTAAFDPAYIRKQAEACKKFYAFKRRLYDEVNACDNGNIVTIREFFLENCKYHIVTERVPAEKVELKDIAALSEKEKLLLLRTIAMNMMRLHERGIVYADIRPDNILYKRSESGKLVAKLIDFDGSFFEADHPKTGIPMSEQYIAPETAELLFEGKDVVLTRQLDVFSLGLLFHLYWTGDMPDFDESAYDFACEALNSGGTLTVSRDIPARLAALIRMMLLKVPSDRPSMRQVFEELKAIAEGKPSVFSAHRPAPADAPKKPADPPGPGGGVKKPVVTGSGARVTFNFGPAPGPRPAENPEPAPSGSLWDIPTDF